MPEVTAIIKIELPELDMTPAEIAMGKYLAQEAHEYVRMDALASEKYAEIASELECRERQLYGILVREQTALSELSELRKASETTEKLARSLREELNRTQEERDEALGRIANALL